jgi:hypothetical protein
VLRNKRFELTKPTLALDAVVRQGWITIPAGEIIRILAGPNGEGNEMIDILWNGRMLTMFAIDLTAGCNEIRSGSTAAGRSSVALDDPTRKQR